MTSRSLRPTRPARSASPIRNGTARSWSAAGFTQVAIDAVEVPFRFGADADEAWDFAQGIGIVRGLLEGVDADTEARALDALRATMQARATADGVVFDSRTWMLRGVR